MWNMLLRVWPLVTTPLCPSNRDAYYPGCLVLFFTLRLIAQQPGQPCVKMATSQPVHCISEYETDHDQTRAVMPKHAVDIVPKVQPTDNLYHWETVVTRSDKIVAWAKASWSRTNEVVRRRTGAPLKRNSAIRRSDRKRTVLITVGKTKLTMNTSATSGRLKMRRKFSFESEQDEQSSIIVGEQEQKKVSGTTSSTGLGVGQDVGGRSTRFHEEIDAQRPVARTFAEILGEPFVPTAYSKGD